MMEPAPTPVSMKGSLPFPQDRLSWLVAGLLVGVLLAVYYGFFYRQLEEANNNAYTFNEPQARDSKDPPPPVTLEVASPNSISSLSRQTLYLSVTNTTEVSTTVKVVPQLIVRGADSADYYVFHDTPDDSQPTLQQGGYLLFSDIPPQASVSQALTVQVLGLNQTEASATTTGQDECQGDQQNGQETDDATGTPEQGSEATDDAPGQLTVSLGFDIWQDTTCYDVKFANSSAMEVDSLRAVAQGVMSFLLLPPWANGFIPFLAIFIVYLFGIPEALGHCFPRSSDRHTWRQRLAAFRRDWRKKLQPLGKFVLWLLIMAGVAVLVLWTLTQLAVVVLAGEDWATILLPGGSLLLLALVAWGIDWFIIQPPVNGRRDSVTMAVDAAAINIRPPAGQPMTMAVNAAALTIGPPDGQPLTMAVNPATLNIQPPDGQPMTMAVNTAALTLQLSGDHPGHCCHPPAALPGETPPPAAESAPVPVETPLPPPASPKRTRKRKQPAAAEQAAQVAAAEQAAQPAAAEQAAQPAAAEQAAQPPAAEQVAPLSPALLALMAQVRDLEAQLASLRVSAAPPAPDAAPPEAQVAPPPEPDVPEQPEGVAPQEGVIFSSPPALSPLPPPTTEPPAPDAAPDDPPPDRDPF